MTNSCTGSRAGEPAVAGGETGDGFCAVLQGMQYCHSTKEAGLFGPVFWQATPELAVAGGSKQRHFLRKVSSSLMVVLSVALGVKSRTFFLVGLENF